MLPSDLIVELRARAHALARAIRASGESGVDPRSAQDVARVVDACDRFEGLWVDYLRRAVDESIGSELQRKQRHDLRTPVGHIVGYLELVGEDFAELTEPGPNLRAWLGEIRRLLARANELAEAVDRELKARAPLISARPSASRRADRGARLLVIDDLAQNRDLLRRQLEREGHEVIEASSGEQGLALLEAHEPDLVLLDIIMPDLDGHATLARLRANARWVDVPVVMLSSVDDVDEVARCIDAGAQDHLPRPFVPELLRARVAALLDRKRLMDELREQHAVLEKSQQRVGELLHFVLPMGARLVAHREVLPILDELLAAGMRFAGARNGALLMQDKAEAMGWRVVSVDGSQEIEVDLELARATATTKSARAGRNSSWCLPLLDLQGQAQAVLQLWGLPEGHPDLAPLLSLASLAAAAIERAEAERELRTKIATLEVQVDAQAAGRQVEAITETEYFVALKRRISEIRGSRNETKPGVVGEAGDDAEG